MIDEKQIEIDGKIFTISKLPYTIAREVAAKYVPGATGEVAYDKNEDAFFKLMSGVAVHVGTIQLWLTTKELINNHIDDFKTGMKLEEEMVKHNFNFLAEGKS